MKYLNLILIPVLICAFLNGKAQINASSQAVSSVKGIGDIAIDFSKPDQQGKIITLSKLKGKYVLLDFWGSWCGACRYGTPHIKQLYTKYASEGLEVLGIAHEKDKDLQEAEKLWRNAVKEDELPWLNVINNQAEMKQDVPKLYQVRAYPTYILIDKEGKIIGRWMGSGGQGIDEKLAEIFGAK